MGDDAAPASRLAAIGSSSDLDAVASASTSTDVVVAGHISLDLYPRLLGPATLEPGRLVGVGPATISTGGVVANTGVALHRLGVRVRLVGKVGSDLFGRAVLDALASRDSELASDMIVSPGDVTSYTIVINPPGDDRSFLHCPGANQSFSAQDVRDELLAGTGLAADQGGVEVGSNALDLRAQAADGHAVAHQHRVALAVARGGGERGD